MPGLLPHLLDFQHWAISFSCTLRRWCLKNDQHWWTPASSEVFSQGTLLTNSLSSLKSALLVSRVEVLLALFLLSRDFKLYLFMVTVAMMAANHHFAHEILCWPAADQGGHLSESAPLGSVPWSCHPCVLAIFWTCLYQLCDIPS